MKTYRFETREFTTPSGTSYVATCYRMTPKGRFNEAVEFAYRFKTAEARDKYVEEFKAKKEAENATAEARKKAKSDAQKNMINPYKVGQVLYRSWGYDQTNIDFYQVVEVGAKSVKVRPIGQKFVRDAGFMCEYVYPDKDAFTGPSETIMIKVYVDYTGKVNAPQCKYSTFDESRKEGLYQSHYA